MQIAEDVRAAVDEMELAVAQVAGPATDRGLGPDGLRSAWGRLVDVLALGPPPQLRTCPHCGGTCMRAATRCSTCWKDLVPPTAPGAPAPEAP